MLPISHYIRQLKPLVVTSPDGSIPVKVGDGNDGQLVGGDGTPIAASYRSHYYPTHVVNSDYTPYSLEPKIWFRADEVNTVGGVNATGIIDKISPQNWIGSPGAGTYPSTPAGNPFMKHAPSVRWTGASRQTYRFNDGTDASLQEDFFKFMFDGSPTEVFVVFQPFTIAASDAITFALSTMTPSETTDGFRLRANNNQFESTIATISGNFSTLTDPGTPIQLRTITSEEWWRDLSFVADTEKFASPVFVHTWHDASQPDVNRFLKRSGNPFTLGDSSVYGGQRSSSILHLNWRGELADVIIFDRVLTTGQRQIMYDYIYNRYGIEP